MSQIINQAIVESKEIKWKSIIDFQPKGFKTGSTEGIRKSFLTHGLIGGFIVFTIKGSSKVFMFDGHTRKSVMIEMEGEPDLDVKFPSTLKCDFLEFKNKQDAAKALLAYQAGKLAIDSDTLQSWDRELEFQNNELVILSKEYELNVVKTFVQREDDGQTSTTVGDEWYLNVKCADEKDANKLYEEMTKKGREVKIIH
jgi:hypothetical protein